MKHRWALKAGKFFVLAIVFTLGIGFIVMQLWNVLIPDLLHGPIISFWQAVGILVLSHLLLRGWGRGHYGGGWRHDRWRGRWEARWAAMTPEEQEKYRDEWKHRCGGHRGEPDPRPEVTKD